MKNTFFWGGKYSPHTLFIGVSEKPEIPEEGMPCAFFLSKKGGWCIDTNGTKHRLYQEYWRSNHTTPKWRDVPGVIAQKWARSNGGGEGNLFTIAENGASISDYKNRWLVANTGYKKCQWRRLHINPNGSRYKHSGGYKYTYDLWAVPTKEFGQVYINLNVYDVPIKFPFFVLCAPWGWHKNHDIYSCTESAAKKNHGYKIWKGDDEIFRSERVT